MQRSARLGYWGLAFGVLAVSAASGLELPADLTIREPAGVARVREPARGGIPLPWGVYRQDQAFKLTRDGKDIPAQILPLVVDEKGRKASIGNLDYEGMLVDFPTRGFAWDRASWALPEGAVNGEGVPISGNLARYHGDICARAYSLCGEPLLKQRAYGNVVALDAANRH